MDAEDWKNYNEHKKNKRLENRRKSENILIENGIAFKKLSDTHFLLDGFDFWPSTGLYFNRATRTRNRGIFNMLKEMKK